MCAAVGACSTDSDVQNNNGPSAGTNGTNGSSTGTNGTNGANGSSGGGTGTNGTNSSSSTGGDTGANGTTNGTTTGGDTGTNGGTTNGTSTGTDDDAGMPMPCTKGPTKGSTVLLIGDSYVDISGKAFGKELQRLAQAAGSLAPGDKYADRSVSGAQMVGDTLLAAAVPTQYSNEKNSDGHITTVVMDGGGNDILIGNTQCIQTSAPPENQSCVTTINNAASTAKTLLEKMASEGVENVVYFFYPNLPGGGVIFGNKDLEKKTLDYAFPLVKEACDTAPLNCMFVDTRGLFPDTADQFQDGIHPTVPNINKIAGKVWQTMVDNCIAQ
jgi:hypothetical protein